MRAERLPRWRGIGIAFYTVLGGAADEHAEFAHLLRRTMDLRMELGEIELRGVVRQALRLGVGEAHPDFGGIVLATETAAIERTTHAVAVEKVNPRRSKL